MLLLFILHIVDRSSLYTWTVVLKQEKHSIEYYVVDKVLHYVVDLYC